MGRMNARRRNLALRSNVADVNECQLAQPARSKFGARSSAQLRRSFVRSRGNPLIAINELEGRVCVCGPGERRPIKN